MVVNMGVEKGGNGAEEKEEKKEKGFYMGIGRGGRNSG